MGPVRVELNVRIPIPHASEVVGLVIITAPVVRAHVRALTNAQHRHYANEQSLSHSSRWPHSLGLSHERARQCRYAR